ncbi:MAG TPA: hypothetical protein VK646_12780 [Actinomycetota bacterium]|nr:hypothetical protein [Actinomycetota bacterium]
MPGLQDVPKDVRTVYLGEFLPDHARAIAVELDQQEIVWWSKEPSVFSKIWDRGGIHLFVDRTKLDLARAIAAGVAG